MDLSVSSLIAGLVFGVFGFYFIKQGKQEANFRRLFFGIGLLSYSYFVPNPWLNWALGVALLVFAYRS